MNPANQGNPGTGGDGRLDEKTARLLEKALQVSPADWDTRRHLIAHFLAKGEAARAQALFREAPVAAEAEEDLLLLARVEAELDPAAALDVLQRILQRNKACARAYLIWAKILRQRGLDDEARRKYGAATLLDGHLTDPEWEAWMGHAPGPKNTPPRPVTAGGDEDADPAEITPEEMAAAVQAATAPDQPARERVTFQDIGGMTDVIERIRMNIIYPFKHPEVFAKFNRTSGGGILLYGPPGCGKTYIARATAGECNANFMPIAITDVLSKWLGESERHLHELFETARRRAPTVVFIDEIDAIGMSRADASAVMAPLVNVLLSEMDGISADNKNVMILGATNAPWRVDSALRRPGRFDRVVFVPPPDAAARAAILDLHLRGLPFEPVDSAKIAQQTRKFSGADIRALVGRAAEQAMMTEMKTGKTSKVTQKMLLDAIKGMRASTTEWLETARNYASYANRAGLYDDLVAYFEAE